MKASKICTTCSCGRDDCCLYVQQFIIVLRVAAIVHLTDQETCTDMVGWGLLRVISRMMGVQSGRRFLNCCSLPR
jgi:hypothetical protein